MIIDTINSRWYFSTLIIIIFFFILIEQIFKTTNPFIYDEKNFSLERSKENNPSYLYMDFKTSGDVQLKVFAKPKSCEDGIHIKMLKCILCLYNLEINYSITFFFYLYIYVTFYLRMKFKIKT